MFVLIKNFDNDFKTKPLALHDDQMNVSNNIINMMNFFTYAHMYSVISPYRIRRGDKILESVKDKEFPSNNIFDSYYDKNIGANEKMNKMFIRFFSNFFGTFL